MTAALDRGSPLPLWAQIESNLRRRLAAGEFDDVFPTEAELTAEFDVSRQTVRQAIGQMVRDGLVERRRGRGTVVTGGTLEQPLRTLYSLARSIEATGLEERSEVLALELRRDEDAAAELGRSGRDQLVYLERLRFAGGEPLALDRSWLPAERTRALLRADLQHGSLYAALAEHCKIRVTGGTERIRAVLPSRDQRARLSMPSREAALLVERLATAGDEAVEVRHTVIRGDRYSFRAEWSGTDSPA